MNTRKIAILAALALAVPSCVSDTDETRGGESVLATGEEALLCVPACGAGLVCDTARALCVAAPVTPAMTFPISGTVTTARPEFSWTPLAGSTGAEIEICKDRACATPLATLRGVRSASPATPIARGTYFVRAHDVRRDAAGREVVNPIASAPRVWRSNGLDVPSRSALGSFSDFNADGISDRPAGEREDATPSTSRVDTSDVRVSGPPFLLPSPVPDMNGDGRTELVSLSRIGRSSRCILRIAHLDSAATPTVENAEFNASCNAQVLALGDADRDGYFDLGLVTPVPAGMRMEILYGGPSYIARRKTLDVGMAAESNGPVELAPGELLAVTAIGDLNNDGFPDIALSGSSKLMSYDGDAATAPPRTNLLVGWQPSYRQDVFLGAASTPYRTRLVRFAAEGLPKLGLQPVGDINGDGVMDVVSVNPALNWICDTAYNTDYSRWDKVYHTIAPALAYISYGGTRITRSQIPLPKLVGEGTATSGVYRGTVNHAEDSNVVYEHDGIKHVELAFDARALGGMDLNADGVGELVFWNARAPQEGSPSGVLGERLSSGTGATPYDTLVPAASSPIWLRFGNFVEVRYGKRGGVSLNPDVLLVGQSSLAPPAASRVRFPTAIAARFAGLYVEETIKANGWGTRPSVNDAIYTGPASALRQIP